MTRKERIIRGQATSEHIVQFFDTTESLADTVSGFLADGYTRGERLIVVAKRKHWRVIGSRLKQRAGIPSRLPADRVTVLDAASALSSFMRQGLPATDLFHETIGELVRHAALAHPGGLRIYGEMVDMLAEEGNFQAAQRLEDLWNDLAARYRFALLCGYSAAHFASSGAREALVAACRAHTHVQYAPQDALAAWILDRAPTSTRELQPRNF